MLKKITFGICSLSLALTATVALAETGSNSSSSRSENHEIKKVASTTRSLLRDRVVVASSTKILDVTCAKAAVDVRKTSLVSAYDKFTSTFKSALSSREDAIKASFDKGTLIERRDARKTARATYRTSVKNAYDSLKSSEKSALKTYDSALKICGGKGEEASGEKTDGSLSESIQ